MALDIGQPTRVATLASLAIGIEWARAFVDRDPRLTTAAIALGGLLLCGTALGTPIRSLGISGGDLLPKLLAGAALGAVLLVPSALRSWVGIPLQPAERMAIALVAVGEEIAFRGALFASIRAAFGSAAAVTGSATAFVLAHTMSHSIDFLIPVAALGLLLGLWRWAFDDLVVPITAHVLADVSL